MMFPLAPGEDRVGLPVAVLSGFLGSGKTTPLNRLPQDPRMAGTAVAINEFGEIPLDQHLIDHGDDKTVVMANGCLCCNLAGDMEDAVMRIFSRESGAIPRFARLVVEPSGLADPAPIAQAILRQPALSLVADAPLHWPGFDRWLPLPYQLAALCKRFPDVFLPGWAMVDPWRGRKGLEDIEHAVKTLGLMGVKYQPPVQGFCPADPHFRPIWDLLQSLGAPVLIHCGTTAIGANEPGGLGFKLDHGRPIHIDSVAAEFPRLNIVAAHPGWPWTEELIAIALHKRNVSIDISGWGPKYIPAPLKHDMQRRLQDKVLFGSDYPGQCCDEWEMQGFKPGVVDKLFIHNATRILGLTSAIEAAERARAAPPEG